MPAVQVTKCVLVSAILALVLYDIYVIFRGGRDASISFVIWQLSLENPIVPFAAGLICGHLFWRE